MVMFRFLSTVFFSKIDTIRFFRYYAQHLARIFGIGFLAPFNPAPLRDEAAGD